MNQSQPYQVVEEPDLAEVLPALIDVLSATRDNQPGLDRFRWLYEQNPEGPAVVWTLRKTETGEVVGFTSCIPRQVCVAGKRRRCWIGADFSILPKYRSLGLALQLRRAARTAIDAGRAEFLYSHPNDRMAVIHDKVGHRQLGTMIRMARLISVKPILQERRETRLLAGVAAGLLDPLLHLSSPEWRTSLGKGTVAEQPLSFSNDFDRLYAEVCQGVPVVGVRDAAYLTWRYQSNPLQRHRLLTYHDGDDLKGYALFGCSEEDNTLNVYDLFPGHDKRVARILLKELWRVAHRERRRSISVTLLSTHPVMQSLEHSRYSRRPETSRMYVYVPESDTDHELLTTEANWYICQGDRDV